MKISCDIVMDLLPLYHDGVCSENTNKAVEEHMEDCDSCKNTLYRIKNNTIDNYLKEEREDIVLRHSKTVKRKSLVVGITIASILAVPILVSLIVNLATGHALDWFFIVLTALMTSASVTVIPLVFEKEKFLWALGSFTASLTLLLLTCALYNGANWFFVALIPIYFGLSLMFMPYLLHRLPLKGFAAHHKGVLAMIIDTFLLFAVIIVSGFYGQAGSWLGYWRPALLITTMCLLLPWGLFIAIRYIKANSFIKAGICVTIGSLFLSMVENLVHWILEGIFHFRILNANVLVWNTEDLINANVSLLILVAGCIVGGILLAVGALQKKHFLTNCRRS
ncbi:MAG: zf-HC2 domain-containing protein [Treponema sp.]|nr:zf-HC2 domain-containing protein [Treponema sp.]